MTIYSFQKVESFLTTLGLQALPSKSVLPKIRDNFPDIYIAIENNATNLTDATYREKLFCYANNIIARPICKMCSNNVRFSPNAGKGYYTYCAGRCAMKDMSTKLGVTNASKLQSVKDKKALSAMTKYGVNNVSKAQSIKDDIGNKAIARWDKLLGSINDIPISSDEKYTSEHAYRTIVARATNNTYATHKELIDPEKKRGSEFQLDHKVSICYGWHNKISPIIIGSVVNLEIIPSKINGSKNYRNSITAAELFEAYNEFYKTSAIQPLVLEDYTMKHRSTPVSSMRYFENESGQCSYCNDPDSKYKNIKTGKWCCSLSPNSCPVQRNKNSQNQIKSDKKYRLPKP